jgi:hypothetical protein
MQNKKVDKVFRSWAKEKATFRSTLPVLLFLRSGAVKVPCSTNVVFETTLESRNP